MVFYSSLVPFYSANVYRFDFHVVQTVIVTDMFKTELSTRISYGHHDVVEQTARLAGS